MLCQRCVVVFQTYNQPSMDYTANRVVSVSTLTQYKFVYSVLIGYNSQYVGIHHVSVENNKTFTHVVQVARIMIK